MKDLMKERAEVAAVNPEFADLICDADDVALSQELNINDSHFTIPEFQGNASSEQTYQRATLMEDFCGFSSEEAHKMAFQQVQTQPTRPEPKPLSKGKCQSKHTVDRLNPEPA